jgi:PhzF family phenazine biosynthesis protein
MGQLYLYSQIRIRLNQNKMKLRIFQADAFTDELFSGNPAAVVPLEDWLSAELMQKIALENNLSETAFYIPGEDYFQLRWFTPSTEVSLCGHATLATAHVLFTHMNYPGDMIVFRTLSGDLTVVREEGLLYMDFPVSPLKLSPTPQGLTAALGLRPLEVHHAGKYLLAVYKNEAEVRRIIPDFPMLAKLPYLGIIVTAPGDGVDFVSRFFAPAVGINEDPATGSAHTALIPYWSGRLGKMELKAVQVSRRGGSMTCENRGDRVRIGGKAITFMEGIMTIRKSPEIK